MVVVRNRDKLLRKHRLLKEDKFFRAVNAGVFEAADMARAEAFRSISSGSASGRKTKKHAHTPSAPGDPPNRDTGVLQANIEITNPKPFVAEVSSNAPYSAALEFGTSKMEARPFMRPARDKTREPALARLIRKLNVLVRTL
ncbi:HK97-gp10 family putative phage morphogenesis protein [Novosphingobium olei]|uniref:HK97 gp10 family phage protein n=1 Tax=Novosphingobium olei TaxID=2728851 RepID=A0A7Y0BRT9_9SPHN|nr:HK97-gp10 family putative phage morphogenesis protein [Novosphingobium olei]NML94741.1 HK97 gp10 family phage protein [Novosphingobium olei]